MTTDEAIAIPLSKTKLILLGLGGVVFVLFACVTILGVEGKTGQDAVLLRLIGIFAFGFFSLAVFVAIRKLFDPRPGLIISADGIEDNSSGVAAGAVAWSEIEGFTVTRVYAQRFLTIIVREPEEYVERSGPFRRILARSNLKLFGSPVHISSNALKIDFDASHASRHPLSIHGLHRHRHIGTRNITSGSGEGFPVFLTTCPLATRDRA